MRSRASRKFWAAFAELPPDIQARARSAYRLFERDPAHPGLQFKRVHATKPIYSVRVTLDYRALGILEADAVVWFWIGNHEQYERLLSGR